MEKSSDSDTGDVKIDEGEVEKDLSGEEMVAQEKGGEGGEEDTATETQPEKPSDGEDGGGGTEKPVEGKTKKARMEQEQEQEQEKNQQNNLVLNRLMNRSSLSKFLTHCNNVTILPLVLFLYMIFHVHIVQWARSK